MLGASFVLVLCMGMAPDTRFAPEAVLGARLCINEANDNLLDCAAIMHIRMRTARSHGRTLGEELLALHGQRSLRPDRATNPHPRDNRPWIGDLNAELREPLGWPSELPPWERMAPRFERVLLTAQGAIDGEVRDPCTGSSRALTWGGPNVDHLRIDRMTRSGWMRVSCGATSNVYLGRAPAGNSPTPQRVVAAEVVTANTAD